MRRAPLLLAVALLAACGSSHASPPKPQFPAKPPSRFEGTAVPPTTAPAIALHDASGRPLKLERGRWTLVTFLYTHCPDVCPLITQNLNQALRLVGAGKHSVGALAVSVDPKGDTPAAVRAFARRMHLVPQFRYAIGTRAELKPVWARYHVAAVGRGAGVVDHVAYTVLVDPRGKERVIYDAQVKAGQIAHDLRVLLGTSPAS